MVLDENLPERNLNAVGYWADQPLHKEFLQNKQFRIHLQNYLENFLSTKVSITLQKWLTKNKTWYEELTTGFMIQVTDKATSKQSMGNAVSDFCQNYFNKIMVKCIANSHVQSWLSHPATRMRYFRCLQYILKKRGDQLFKVLKLVGCSLKIHYLAKEPFAEFNSEEIDRILQNEVLHEVIYLSSVFQQLQEYRDEIRKIRTEFANVKDVVINFVFIILSPLNIKYKITLFGHFQNVNQIKERISKIDKRHRIVKPKLDSMNILQIEALLGHCPFGVRDIKKEYKDITSDLYNRIKPYNSSHEFEIESQSYIEQLVLGLKTVTFKSFSLPKEVAEKAEKHLHNIAHRNYCCIKTELIYRAQHISSPKSSLAISHASNLVKEQSFQFCSSSDVVTKIAMANGSIEIRTGDISQQQVDAIIISNSPDGLQEGLIERAGLFSYEQAYVDVTGRKFTKTDSGNLHCKRILFCDWLSLTDTTNESELRVAIQTFVAKSLEYAMKDDNLKSIAFATPDLSRNERILAQELLDEAKRQLESTNLQLTISFVLLTEQRSLLNELFIITSSMQNVKVQFEWTTAIIRIMLIALELNDINKCKEKINTYLNHCVASAKITDSDEIFNYWDQHTINAFYKYCKDRHVLPQINQTGNELELNGPTHCIHEAKRKWYLQRELLREKTFNISKTERRDSAHLSARTTVTSKKVCNIIIIYSKQDVQSCQRLINRLVEEEFNVWAEPVRDEQLRDISSQMNKADCAIVCVSENLYESPSCEKETRYVFETGKPVLLVKVKNDSLTGWQREVFEGKLFIHLFGSGDHFDMEYNHLLLKIYRFIKPSHALQCKYEENEALRSLLTIEQRRAVHDEKIKTLMKIGHIKKEDLEELIEQSKNVPDDVDDYQDDQQEGSETISDHRFRFQSDEESLFQYITRWLSKSANVTKQNLPPFAPSGDINDAPFPMPQYIMRCLHIEDESIPSTHSYPPKLQYKFDSNIFVRSTEQSFPRTLFKPIPADKETVYGGRTKGIQLFDASQNPISHHLDTDYVSSPKTTRLPLIPAEVLSTNEKALQKYRKSRLKTKKMVQQDESHTEEMNTVSTIRVEKRREFTGPNTLELYRKKFAEQMRKNIAEFEAFCLADESKASVKKKRSKK